MKIFAIGSSITSSYWNGAATYYRGIYKALHRLGHEITFAEPDIYGRQQHRERAAELDSVEIEVEVYRTVAELRQLLRCATGADLIVKHSGVGEADEYLEELVLELKSPNTRVTFWDVDAPATLQRVESNARDPLRKLIPQYDLIFTYGGGAPVVEHYTRLGAQACYPIYNAVDPETHFPVTPLKQFECDLAFVGNRLPDRERRVEEFFVRAAQLAPEMQFLLGGEGWGNKTLPPNVRWMGHVKIEDHNAINCSARMVLNVNRESMAQIGFSPPTRIFEAAGAGACVITDSWPGIESFFEPGSELLIADSAECVISFLRSIGRAGAAQIAGRIRARVLRDHTYSQRAELVHQLLHLQREASAVTFAS